VTILQNNLLAVLIAFAVAFFWLRTNNFVAHRGWVRSQTSRKVIHIGTGPLFVLCWLLFTPDSISRYIAALVPLAITAQFFLVGTGVIKDPSAVEAMSRTGERREVLRGPLYYGIVFVVLTIFFWYDSPTGIVALMLMCGGDGLADILGRRFGRTHLPWNEDKSWMGSIGMFIGGWSLSIGIIWIFIWFETIPTTIGMLFPAITFIALVGTIVESLPLKDLDNITVTLAAVILGFFLF
jgi:phytol kinase